MDHGEHCNYRSTLASKLGLRGGGEKERSTMPIKRASGGSIPKLARGEAFRNLGKAIKHGVVRAANKVASGAKNFARKEKEGFEEIGRKINRNVVRPSEHGFNKYIENPVRKAAATAKNMSREISHDINKNAIKPARRYLDESMHKDDNGMKRGGCKKYANGGMPRPMYPAVMPPQGQQGRRMPPNAQSYAPQQPLPMKRGGKTRHYEDGGEAMAMGGLKLGLGTRVKSNFQTRHNFQNDGRMLAGEKEKSQYGAKERGERKEKGLPTMAAGGIGKMRHEAMPKTGGSVNSPMRNRKDYM